MEWKSNVTVLFQTYNINAWSIWFTKKKKKEAVLMKKLSSKEQR